MHTLTSICALHHHLELHYINFVSKRVRHIWVVSSCAHNQTHARTQCKWITFLIRSFIHRHMHAQRDRQYGKRANKQENNFPRAKNQRGYNRNEWKEACACERQRVRRPPNHSFPLFVLCYGIVQFYILYFIQMTKAPVHRKTA